MYRVSGLYLVVREGVFILSGVSVGKANVIGLVMANEPSELGLGGYGY
jgi:hypothetical protein